MPKLLSIIPLLLIVACSPKQEISITPNPTGDSAIYPRLYTDNVGVVYMSWMEENGDSTLLYYSTFDGTQWSNPKKIASSDSWFVNWADFPAIIGTNGQPMVAHKLAKVPGTPYSYNVEITSLASGATKVPHTDGTATEHGFVSMVPTSDSTFYAVWLDGRNTADGDGSNYHGNLATAMTIRGAELDRNLNILNEAEIDNSTCDCCNTALAKTNSGLIVVYRDRTSDEIRDMYVSRFVDGAWSEPVAIFNDGWNIAACPVNGAAISTDGQNVAVAWFTGANNIAKVKVVFSTDEGVTFSEPISTARSLQGAPLGRVDIELINENTAWVSWLHRGDESGYISLMKINQKGEVLQEFSIPDVETSRSTGFPQITKSGNGLLIAWTDISGEEPVIRTASLQ